MMEEQLLNQTQQMYDVIQELQATIGHLEHENKILREALEWYASYESRFDDDGYSIDDCGQRAREALEKTK